MTPKQYSFAVAEAANYNDIDAYISELATSSIWEDAADAQIPATRADDLRQIWTAVHRSFKQILNDACVTQAKFCDRFAVPTRTVEAWSMGERACAVYDRLMFQQLLGLLQVSVPLFDFAHINKYNIERKYIVVDELKHRGHSYGFVARWRYVYDTPEEANAQASMRWYHLTPQERQKRHVYAGMITRNDLDDDAVDEDTGEVDWKRWNNCNTFPGALDSYNLEEE